MVARRRRRLSGSSFGSVAPENLEPLPVGEWQVIQGANTLRVLLRKPREIVDMDGIATVLTRDLRDAGAEPPPVHVEIVEK